MQTSLAARQAAAARPLAMTAPSRRPATAVCAKPTRASDFASLSTSEALARAGALKTQYFQLQYFKRSRGATLNPDQKDAQPDADKVPKGSEYKAVRRQIAQLLTMVRQRQAADGIDRRAALAIQKAASVDAGFGKL